MTTVMQRLPTHIAGVPGIFALTNRKRRFAYIAWTRNLQKRSHALAHMLDQGKSSIRDLPITDPSGSPLPADEFIFIVLKENVTNEQAERSIVQLKRPFEEKNYRFIEGSRSPMPLVTLDGQQMTLAEAVEGTGVRYTTAWRRLERGWTIEQAIGREAAPPRWGKNPKSRRKGKSNDNR